MFCENPKDGYPCGKCRACKASKSNKKMIISVFAAAEYKRMYLTQGQFLTLTFNDDYKPDGLDHSIFQGFMKRLRRRDGTPDVKYFMAGEYGEEGEGHREHFHILFYNHKYSMDDVNSSWSDPKNGHSFGFTYDGTLTPESMKYVSGYVDKKGYDPQSGKRPPYGRSSCNIPDGLSDLEISKMCLTGKIDYNGRKFAVPENWRRRYADIWKATHLVRREYQEEYERNHPRKELTPAQVTALMDERDRYRAAKKAEKKIKRLQKEMKRRIM